MKKLIMALAVAIAATCTKAATVDWQVTSATAAETDYMVYVFASEVTSKYESYSDLIAGNIGSGKIVEVAGRKGSTYKMEAAVSSTVDSGTEKLWYVIIANEQATEFAYGSSSISALVYDPNQQQSSPGSLQLTNASFSSTGTIGQAAPEPTSGLLLLLGMAGLALRRKQK